MINWHTTSDTIYRLYRGLTFGQEDNTFASPKIYYHGQGFIIQSLQLTSTPSTGVPGQVRHISQTSITVATKTYNVEIIALLSLTGETYPLHDWVAKYRICIGDILPSFPSQAYAAFKDYAQLQHKKKHFGSLNCSNFILNGQV